MEGGGSPQEAEATFTLLSYSSSVKYQASAPWVTKNPTNEQVTFHMLPSDSKKVAKTAASFFQSGGLEVAGRRLGGESQRGIRRGRGGSEWGEEGRPWLLGWVRPGGGWNLPRQIQDDQARLRRETEVKANCCQSGCQAHKDQSFCMRRTPLFHSPGPQQGNGPCWSAEGPTRGQAGPSAPWTLWSAYQVLTPFSGRLRVVKQLVS